METYISQHYIKDISHTTCDCFGSAGVYRNEDITKSNKLRIWDRDVILSAIERIRISYLGSSYVDGSEGSWRHFLLSHSLVCYSRLVYVISSYHTYPREWSSIIVCPIDCCLKRAYCFQWAFKPGTGRVGSIRVSFVGVSGIQLVRDNFVICLLIISPFASRCWIPLIDSIVDFSIATVAIKGYLLATLGELYGYCLQGWASFIALVGSAFEVILNAAFSFGVSIKSALEKDPLLLRFLLLEKLSRDLVRGLRCSISSILVKRFFVDYWCLVKEKTWMLEKN